MRSVPKLYNGVPARASTVSEGSTGLSHPSLSSSGISLIPRFAYASSSLRSRGHIGGWRCRNCLLRDPMRVSSCTVRITRLYRGRAPITASRALTSVSHTRRESRGEQDGRLVRLGVDIGHGQCKDVAARATGLVRKLLVVLVRASGVREMW